MTESMPWAPDPADRHLLTPREVDVLVRWVSGDSKREIAGALFITEGTVHTHLARIRTKYQDAARPAGSRIALLVRAVEDGYTTLNQISQHIGARGDIAPFGLGPVRRPVPPTRR